MAGLAPEGSARPSSGVSLNIPRSPERLEFLERVVSDKHKNLLRRYKENASADGRLAIDEGDEDAPRLASDLEFANALANLTNNNIAITKSLVLDPNTSSLRDVAANYNKERLLSLFAKDQPDAKSKQQRALTSSDLAAAERAVESFQRKLFTKETSGYIVRMLRDGEIKVDSDEESELAAPKVVAAANMLLSTSARTAAQSDEAQKRQSINEDVIRVLENNPQFNFRKNSVIALLADPNALDGIASEQKPVVEKALKHLQGAQALSAVPEALPALFNARLSAFHVAQIPGPNFISQFKESVGGETIARQIHDHAVRVSSRNDQALTKILQTARGTGLAAIDGGETRQQRLERMKISASNIPEQINLEKLFGSLDYCECDECNSVLSPAAYFVELLQYLRNNNLHPDRGNSNSPGFRYTPLEKLFRRRPDLACLELTCANTNTVLPYIDLANEVMESFVVHLNKYVTSKQVFIDVWNASAVQEGLGGSSAELLASPQNTNYAAYCILHKAVYPATKLPYHQPIDSIRLFLQFLQTSRADLIEVFQGRYLPPEWTSEGTWDTEHCYNGCYSPEPSHPATEYAAQPSPNSSASTADTDEYDSHTEEDEDDNNGDYYGHPDSHQRFKPTPITAAQRGILRQIHAQAIARSVDAEQLLLSEEEYIILTKEAFWPKGHFDIRHGTNTSLSTYQERIGLRKVWEYWGLDYSSESDMVDTNEDSGKGLTFVKAQFLPRSGILYEELVELIKTEYVNPRMLKGRDKVVMESLRFSYKYLATLVDPSEKHKRARLCRIIDLIEDPASHDPVVGLLLFLEKCKKSCCEELWEYLTERPQFSLLQDGNPQNSALAEEQKKQKRLCSSCHKSKHDKCQCGLNKELRKWIHKHFESVGKITILDNGEGPKLPWKADIILHNYDDDPPIVDLIGRNITPVAHAATELGEGDVLLGHLYSDGKILKPAPSTELLATVSISGKVTYTDGRPFMVNYQDPKYVVRLKRTDIVTEAKADGFINADSIISLEGIGVGNAAWTPVIDDCDITKTRLIHLDGGPVTHTEYDRMHRFLRLWRKLGWTMPELDAALRAFGVTAPQQPAECENPTPPEEPDADEDDVSLDDYNQSCEDGNCGKSNCATCGRDHGSKTSKSPYQPEKRSTKACLRCRRRKRKVCSCEHPQTAHTKKPLPEITPYFLHQVAVLKKLLDLTGYSLMKLLSLWGQLDTYGPKSLYAQLFLTHNMLGIDTIFQPDEDGNYLAQTGDAQPKISNHHPIILTALQLTTEDLKAILSIAQIAEDAYLTLDSISAIYRHSTLAKLLGVKPKNLSAVFSVLFKPWESAQKAFDLIQLWSKISESGFSFKELAYALNGIDDPLLPISPSFRTILQTASTLYTSFGEIDERNPLVTALEAATTEAVRAKVELLYTSEVSGEIIAFLDGTTRYTTNAPKGLVLVIPDDLKPKLSYADGDSPFVQVLGQLTPEEGAKAKSLSSSPKWSEAIDRLGKRAATFFRTTFTGIFINEAEAKAKLLAGDIPPPATVEAENLATAPGKRHYFLQHFVPFLRKRLADKAVIETLSTAVSLPPEVTADLVEDILVFDRVPDQENSGVTARELIEQIRNTPANNGAGWRGYLIPPTTKKYTIAAKSVVEDIRPLDILIDGVPYLLSIQQEDPTNIWYGTEIKLNGGQLYKLEVPDQSAYNLLWGMPPSPLATIPKSCFLSEHATSGTARVLVALTKAAIVINGLGLTHEEAVYFQNHGADFGNFDLNQVTRAAWERIADYTKLKSRLPKVTATLLDLFTWAASPTAKKDETADKIAELTLWNIENVKSLLASKHFDLASPSAHRNEQALLKLEKAIGMIMKTQIAPDKLFAWAKPRSNFWESHDIAESIRKAIRARYLLSEWEVAIKPVYDTLRQNQSNALVAYLLAQPHLRKQGVFDADSLFEFFLIDVSMCPCMETARLKQATSSVQLFIQRCLLGLEDQGKGFGQGVGVNELDRERWIWMQRYRVWEANRKVYLYPENWIVSSLRDDKSPQFKALESEMLQKDVNEKGVLDALKNYLFAVDEIANLLPTALYLEDEEGEKLRGEKEPKRVKKKIHFFASTRQAPCKHFYRYFDYELKEWSAWEHMQIDIPNYEVESSKHVSNSNLNGSYVVPFMYNNRLLVGLPQFMKKQSPKVLPDKSFAEIGNGDDDFKANDVIPDEYWEIKLGITELLNGKWKQKVVSTEALLLTPVKPDNLPEVSKYQFVPRIPEPPEPTDESDDDPDEEKPPEVHIIVLVEGKTEVGRFIFTGTLVTRDPVGSFTPNPTVDGLFQAQSDDIKSLQVFGSDSSDIIYSDYPYVHYSTGGNVTSSISFNDTYTAVFYHQFVHALLNRATRSDNLDDLFGYFGTIKNKKQDKDAFGSSIFSPQPSEAEFKTYNELYRPYSLYNWEIGFHAPMALVDKLLQTNQFDLALKFCHYIFNPYAKGDDDKRWWLWPPFKRIDAINSMDKLFSELRPNESVPIEHQINRWRDNPFQPHVLARLRPVAYMKWVVMKYIEILIAYGDYYFKQNTLEMIPMAIQCYVLASHVYGPRGQKIPKRGKKKGETYFSLVNKWDAFDNAMVELELQFPFSNQTDKPWGQSNGVIGLANIFGFATSRYFCIPDNPQLTALRDKIDNRLFKIRHCQDINGVERKLALYEPAIDPGLLVAAAAAGLSLESVLADLSAPMPNYRFPYLLSKALELCSELKSLSGAFLTAKEKQDGEAMAILRQKHESSIQNLAMEQRKLALEEAAKNLEALSQSRERPKYQLKHTLQLLGEDEGQIPSEDEEWKEIAPKIDKPLENSGLKMNEGEVEESDKSSQAHKINQGSSTIQAMASQLHILPSINLHASVFGVGPATCFGPPNIADGMNGMSTVMRIAADSFSYESGDAARRNNILRSSQDRILSANTTGYDIKNIDRQIVTQRVRIAICNSEITSQQQQIDNMQEITDFLTSKYTNEDLYIFMEQTVQTLCYQTYQMAYDWAKKAEKAFRFERGITESPNFIGFGYWQPARDGLMAGEKLFMSLKNLEAAYHERRGHDYEVTKHISLRQINPLALLKLRESASCEFLIPEVLFDMDFPGHYLRKVKSVAVTIPCVVGPYTTLNCTLRLLAHKYRTSAIARDKRDYAEKTDQAEADPRFNTVNVPIDAIAVTSGQNDAGVFELNFKDERYLPFEGAGAISHWRLELPAGFRQFDYSTITDIVVHLKYTSLEGGGQLKAAAAGSVEDYIKGVTSLSENTGLFAVLDIRTEFSTEWYRFRQPLNAPDATSRVLTLKSLNERLPIYTKGSDPRKLVASTVWIVVDSVPFSGDAITVSDGRTEITFQDAPSLTGKHVKVFSAQGPISLGDWSLTLTDTVAELGRMWIIARYAMAT